MLRVVVVMFALSHWLWRGYNAELAQAVGETWEKFPELRFLALKRMHKYAVRTPLSALSTCDDVQGAHQSPYGIYLSSWDVPHRYLQYAHNSGDSGLFQVALLHTFV